MNRPIRSLLRVGVLLSLTTLASCLFHGSVKDPGADKVSAELSQLQADPQLASRAPVALKEAQDAVAAAQVAQKDPAESAHLVYLADRKVQTARALAEARVAEDQLKALQGP
ncbi:DUF4398 domain-containing protein [Nevskia soli]|uniref:DUF4398 domain-containing protein n=1 Tax=Nevskia soli TaxID=418856 RepID=UPI000A057E83|nr:DUF4398 domain-containing protein [Nevskia soli]